MNDSWQNPSHQRALEFLERKERDARRAKELYDLRKLNTVRWPTGIDPDIVRVVVPPGYDMQGVVRRLLALFAAKELGKDALTVLGRQKSPFHKSFDLGQDLERFCVCPNCDGSHWSPPSRILQTVMERLEETNADSIPGVDTP